MARKIEDIFNECYERIRSGESLESCLRSYPQYRSQLEPLLRTTFDIGRRSSYIQPRPEFRHWSRVRLEAAQRYPRQAPQQMPFETPMASTWLRHGWAIAVIVGIILMLGTGSTMAASSNALPDEPLYPVKLATEQIQLALAVTPTRQAQVETDIATARAAELAALAEQGKTEEAAKAAERYNAQYEKALDAIMKAMPQPSDYVPQGTTVPSEITIPTVTQEPSVTPPAESQIPIVATPPTTVEQPAVTTETPQVTQEQPPATQGQPTTTGQPPATTEQPAATTGQPTTTEGQAPAPKKTATTSKDSSATRIEQLKKTLDHNTTRSITALKDARDKASDDTKPNWQKAIDTVKKSYSKSDSGSGTTSVSDNQTGKSTTNNQTVKKNTTGTDNQTQKKTYPMNRRSTHR